MQVVAEIQGAHSNQSHFSQATQPRRQHAPHSGELIQIDGSEHAWFEGRAPRCTLLVFVDDATSELMELRVGHPLEGVNRRERTLVKYSNVDSVGANPFVQAQRNLRPPSPLARPAPLPCEPWAATLDYSPLVYGRRRRRLRVANVCECTHLRHLDRKLPDPVPHRPFGRYTAPLHAKSPFARSLVVGRSL
jgi:hypothetical protein